MKHTEGLKLVLEAEREGVFMKIFRDPIHNVINLDTGDEATNDLIIALIGSKEFQRLRFIKQLGFAYFAYPSATHSRLEHSLGVAFLAKRFIKKILSLEEKMIVGSSKSAHRDKFVAFFDGIKKSKDLTIIAALLHDIGHGPLSHATKYLTPFYHKEWAEEIIMGNTEVNELLVKFDKQCPQIIVDILKNKNIGSYPASKLISGQIDIDKIDYLLRDSHMTGSKYGEFDLEWLLSVLTVGIKDDKVEIGLELGKGLNFAEDFVMSRIYMFRNVYLHRTNLLAQNMLKLIFERIRELSISRVSKFFPNDHLKNVIFSRGQTLTMLLDDYLAISDIDLFYFLKTLQKSDDEILSGLSEGIMNRRLFKEVDAGGWEEIEAFVGRRKAAVSKYYMTKLNVEAREEGLTYRPGIDEIFLFEKDGTGHELLEKSRVISQNVHNDTIVDTLYVDIEMHNEHEQSKAKHVRRRLKMNIDHSHLEELMIESIEQAMKSVSEERSDDKVSPKVGAVLCDADGKILLTAYRGEGGEGHHCEFSLLTKAAQKDIDLSETILFVTLEPCTQRGEGKISCAQRIVDVKIPKVYMGSLDPYDPFRGKGEFYLRDHGVEVERYPDYLIRVISTMNKEFEEYHKNKGE